MKTKVRYSKGKLRTNVEDSEMVAYLNTFKRHHHWRFHANRRYQWRFQSIKSENAVLTGASLQASAQQHCKDLGLQLFLHCSRHCCWRFQSQLSKSENAAGTGASLATCLVQLEGAIRTGAMHGQLREKGLPWEIPSEQP